MEALYFGSAGNAAFLTAVLTGFGVLFAVIVYKLMTSPRSRREEFQQMGRFSRPTAGAVAAAILLAFSAFGYWLFLTPFYAVELDGAEARLVKFYPRRAVTLTRDEIARFERRNEVTKNSYVVSLVVYTKDGRRYESGQANPQQLAADLTRLNAWLGKSSQ